MSIRMIPCAARLTVLGRGWDKTALESGDAFTENGELLSEVAEALHYDIGINVDWDLIANDSGLDWDGVWGSVIYTDSKGVIYDNSGGGGIWTDKNGNEYLGDGTRWLAKAQLLEMSDLLEELAQNDAALMQYSVPNSVLPSLYGGKVSVETNPTETGAERPHTYTPDVWFIQKGSKGIIFLDEPFYHDTAIGGSITVYDEAITIRDGSPRAVYWSSCDTKFSDTSLPSEYSDYPIQYVCWQCLYGSLGDALISKTENTITSEDIKNGAAELPTMTYGGKTYFAVSMHD